MQDILFLPEVVELVGRAALPVVEALEAPAPRENVARRTRPALDELCRRADLPRELASAARSALVASRSVSEGDGRAYGQLLRATHELLRRAGLPAPCELSEGTVG
jgi:hypothetical protein